MVKQLAYLERGRKIRTRRIFLTFIKKDTQLVFCYTLFSILTRIYCVDITGFSASNFCCTETEYQTEYQRLTDIPVILPTQ